MHALEKILARHAGVASVRAGDIVNCEIDVCGINDLYLQAVHSFREIGGKTVAKPDGVLVFLDHYAPASTIRQAQNQKSFREFCAEQNIPGLVEINEGVCHQVMADKGYSLPGRLLVVTDSHSTTHGAFGAFGTGVGATDAACVLKTGKLWFRVPDIVRIRVEGQLPKGVAAKDVILHIIGDLKADYALYKGVEFCGSAVAAMSLSERMCLCNMTTEMGAKTAYIQPDETTVRYLESIGASEYEIESTDGDFAYSDERIYDVSHLSPRIAAPFSVDNVSGIENHLGVRVDQAFLGTCTGGRIEDIAVAARILKGKKISPSTRMLIVPASKRVLLEAIRLGYSEILIEAGATFVTPGCAACLGTHEGLIADGEVCIASSSRNFPGRMGHERGRIYLASPATVAASALEGRISDPASYLQEGKV